MNLNLMDLLPKTQQQLLTILLKMDQQGLKISLVNESLLLHLLLLVDFISVLLLAVTFIKY